MEVGKKWLIVIKGELIEAVSIVRNVFHGCLDLSQL